LLFLIMLTTYLLYSPDYDKIYIGYTSDVEQRLLSHNVFAKKDRPQRLYI